jgi:hypothetical protein
MNQLYRGIIMKNRRIVNLGGLKINSCVNDLSKGIVKIIYLSVR